MHSVSIWVPLLAAALAFSPACSRQHPSNVLLITIDTLRADRLGCYGYSLARTPALDALAAQGVLCADATTAAPITMPSHSTILTGLYPPTHGVRDNGAYSLGDDTVTLAERLRDEEYWTHAIVSAIVLNRRYNLTQGFDAYDDDLYAQDEPSMFMIRDRPASGTADRALKWLTQWSAQPPPGKPFFLWVHFFDPHQPYEPPAKYRLICPTPYDAEIAAADEAVGRVIDDLRVRGVLDQTIVIMSADHGESVGEHQEKTHALFIYDATIHIPMIFRYPHALPAGRVYGGPVRTVDIVPTILGMLGLPIGRDIQGLDLTRAFRGKSDPVELPQYCESLLSEVGFGMAPLYGVRSGGYKWIRAPKPELYDLHKDPRELHNIAAADPDRAARLDHELQRLLDESEKSAKTTKDNPMTRETEEMLRSLGYLASSQERKSMGGMDPKDGIAIYNKLEDARQTARQKRWEESEKLLREILQVLQHHLTARSLLGFVLMRQGRLEEARDAYMQALAEDPNQFRIYGALGNIALAQGDLDEADRQYQMGLKVTPGYVEALANLGFIESLRGHEEKAKEWYAKAIAADPGFPRVQRLLGDLYYERGKFDMALGYYRKAIEAMPSDFQAIIQAGNCARRVGDATAAAELYRRAGTLRPDSWIPAYNLACVEAVAGESARAMELLKDAAKKGLKNPDLLQQDPDLVSLRTLPAFRALLAVVAAHPGGEEAP